MNIKSALELLDLKPGATIAQLQKAYHKKAVLTHPDKGGRIKAFLEVKTARDHLVRFGTKTTADERKVYVASTPQGRNSFYDIYAHAQRMRQESAFNPSFVDELRKMRARMQQQRTATQEAILRHEANMRKQSTEDQQRMGIFSTLFGRRI